MFLGVLRFNPKRVNRPYITDIPLKVALNINKSIKFIHKVLDHTTHLIPPRFIEVPVPSQESDRSCIRVLVISILFLFTIVPLDIGSPPSGICNLLRFGDPI